MPLHIIEMHTNMLLNTGFLSSAFTLQQGKDTVSPVQVLPNPRFRTSNVSRTALKEAVTYLSQIIKIIICE